MTREERLDAYLRECHDRSFDWASWTCWHYVDGWLSAESDACGIAVRLLMDGLPRIESKRHAASVLRSLGEHQREIVVERLRMQEVAAAYARTGDIVIFTDEGITSLGLCNGRLAVCIAPIGLSAFPMWAARSAVRLP